MNTASIYHRPESEFAYILDKHHLQLRLKTARNDIKEVYVVAGDPYDIDNKKWYQVETSLKKVATTRVSDYWEVTIPSETSRMQYGFHLVGEDELEVFYGDQGIFPYTKERLAEANQYFRMPYFQVVDQFKTPNWVKQTVWYQIFPERFANGDVTNDPKGTLPWGSKTPDREDFFGGDLRGIIDHLDYLEDLGVNGLYFTPIFKAKSNHKYDTIDYLEVDPHFGDKETFKKLVQKAHAKGIRIMLDAVFNHLGDFSEQWQDVITHGEKSRYKDWFHISEFPVGDFRKDTGENTPDLTYETFAYTPHMPKLNTENPEVQKFLLEVATYWIKEFDIDAWRLDVANEVDHQFWKKFHQVVVKEKPDVYILGEIWHSSQNWLAGDEFHAVMNYAFTDNIKNFFVEKKMTKKEDLVFGLNQQQMLYRDEVNEVAFNLLDSHDTARILTVAKNNKDLVKAAFAFMFLQKGTPCLYYGTEISMTGGNDPECRKCMVWEKEQQDLENREFFKKLIAFRKDNWQLIETGTRTWKNLENEDGLLVFEITSKEDNYTAIFNYSEEDKIWPQPKEVVLSNAVSFEETAILSKNGFMIFK